MIGLIRVVHLRFIRFRVRSIHGDHHRPSYPSRTSSRCRPLDVAVHGWSGAPGTSRRALVRAGRLAGGARQAARTITGQVRVTGAKVEDWEAIAVGPCGSGSCVYVGDIGDNDAERKRITIYRVPEPEQASGTAAVSDALHATYPDGAHDAETLFFAGGRLYVVTKGETGPVAMYRFPDVLRGGTSMQLERVGGTQSKRGGDSWITDGTVSPDGEWVVLRSRSSLTFYRASELLAGNWRAVSTVELGSLKEPQGEGVEFGSDGAVYLAGEGGGKGRAGTFARFACAPAATMR
jgi:hypothetical protein